MGLTVVEKILAAHAGKEKVQPGDIVEIAIDTRVARDFGGANVVQHLRENHLAIADPARTIFTFDCNPTGSDQKYAANQHLCRLFARENGIQLYDINAGIGTHILIDEGLVLPGFTAVSTDSHANILGAIGAFGQGMGDMDIAAIWAHGKTWFRVPRSVKIDIRGEWKKEITAKDIVLNLLDRFGANTLLGASVELTGEAIEKLSLDARITIASMATEMSALIFLLPPGEEVLSYCSARSGKKCIPVLADEDAHYDEVYTVEASSFTERISLPGNPENTVPVAEVAGKKIDSGFIGSCTNGRMEDMRTAAAILKGRKVAPGVVLKVVPATSAIWRQCLDEGILRIFQEAGALVSNPGCAGCAAGQVGQNGPGEVTLSTGNRNFPGKQGKGEVYLASPAIVAASAVAGYITFPHQIPSQPAVFKTLPPEKKEKRPEPDKKQEKEKSMVAEGKIWRIDKDNIDTDMIFHNRHLTITNREEMGKYAFGNLAGFEDFAKNARPGDIIVTGKNFGAGSSRQQAVDCFIALGIQCIVAESFAPIYERNAINAGFPIVSCPGIQETELKTGDRIRVNFATGEITNLENNKKIFGTKFSEVQRDIYFRGGILQEKP
ncbi:MAG: 3-isopropylmalate dehydratase large subunit [Bacteroidales bacterium]|nr:3-isopropylmalate dehydratase large subunit [Bacteroidales bacterium]